MALQPIDWLAIGAYVLVIAAAGLLLSRKPRSSEDYFLAGRSLRWPFIGASLFAANISAEHFVGLAGSGYSGGMAVGGYEWSAVFCLVPLITLFLPFMETPLMRPWLHAAMLAFAVSMVAFVAVSLATPRTSDLKLSTTTLSDWGALVAPGTGRGLQDYRLWLALLLLTTASLWFAMR
jgi:hypothetical protein